MNMVAFGHTSVLADEVIEWLGPRAGGVYCDGTLGAGGHAERILEASAPDGRLIGIDRDPVALETAKARLERFGDRVTVVHGAFADARELLTGLGVEAVDGFMLDLGVSSLQLDRGERGFSFGQDGPLDMRMDTTQGETAAELLRSVTEDELKEILSRYGEERFAGRVARAIHEAVAEGKVSTTTELAAVITRAVPRPKPQERAIHPATRTFQALRIAVNGELEQLERFLAGFPTLLKPGGRLVVIAFHSLEDRLVKQRFRDLEWTSRLPPDLAKAAGERTVPVVRVLTGKPVSAGEAELAANPRSRSAKLRACEKVAAAAEVVS
jgi:16S rRNA (cytosine1402-N4)-methyltransferase